MECYGEGLFFKNGHFSWALKNKNLEILFMILNKLIIQ